MGSDWRLLLDGPVDGVENMVRDRAIQLAVEAGDAPPTVRIYSWRRPTVTLGRFQELSTLDLDACDRFGIDVVRRFTGGRGVLHDHEVTYAVIAGVDDGVPRGVAASYRYLCRALVIAYDMLGVKAELTPGDSGDRRSAACYLQNTRADLSAGTAKLSGSAQVWHGSTVLQHGSFTITRDPRKEAAVFSLSDEQSRRLQAKTVTLAQLCDPVPREDQITRAVVTGFAGIAGGVLVPGELTSGERQQAEALRSSVVVRP